LVYGWSHLEITQWANLARTDAALSPQQKEMGIAFDALSASSWGGIAY